MILIKLVLSILNTFGNRHNVFPDKPIPELEFIPAARVGPAAGAARDDAEAGTERDVRVQPAAVSAAAPAPLRAAHLPAVQLLLRQGARWAAARRRRRRRIDYYSAEQQCCCFYFLTHKI